MNTTANDLPESDRLAYGLDDLVRLTPFSRRTLERHVATGRLRATRIGGRVVVLRADAMRFLRGEAPTKGSAKE